MADEYKPDLGLNDGLSDPRVAEILNVFVKYTSLDFSEKVSISEEGDEIDAIAIGLNALGEELKFKHEQEQEYRKQLEGYSTQLESKNKELKKHPRHPETQEDVVGKVNRYCSLGSFQNFPSYPTSGPVCLSVTRSDHGPPPRGTRADSRCGAGHPVV